MKNLTWVFLVFLVIAVVTGCSSVSLHNSWKDSGVPAKQYRTLLGVGISEKRQVREVFEEVFASEIVKKGGVAVASYTITADKDKLTRANLEEAVNKSSVDGVITTRMVGMKKVSDVRSGFIMTDRGYTNTGYIGSNIYPTDLFDFYGGSAEYVTFEHASVEVTTSTEATIEINLFDSGTGRLVWSGTSTAVNPEGVITVSRDLADTVIKAMTKDGLL